MHVLTMEFVTSGNVKGLGKPRVRVAVNRQLWHFGGGQLSRPSLDLFFRVGFEKNVNHSGHGIGLL